MTTECARCGDEMGMAEGASCSLTSMHGDGVGEIDAFLCDGCAGAVRDLLEGTA